MLNQTTLNKSGQKQVRASWENRPFWGQNGRGEKWNQPIQRKQRCLREKSLLTKGPKYLHPQIPSTDQSGKAEEYIRLLTEKNTVDFWKTCCLPEAATTQNMSVPEYAFPLAPWHCCTGMSQRGRNRYVAPVSPVGVQWDKNQAMEYAFSGGRSAQLSHHSRTSLRALQFILGKDGKTK